MVTKVVIPESEQEPHESRRFVDFLSSQLHTLTNSFRQWSKLSEAIANKDMDAATAAKTAVEEAQRDRARKREELGVKYEPHFFKLDKDCRWVPKEQYVPQELAVLFSHSPH